MTAKTLPNIRRAFYIYLSKRAWIGRGELLKEIQREANITEWQLLNALKQINRASQMELHRLEVLRAERKAKNLPV